MHNDAVKSVFTACQPSITLLDSVSYNCSLLPRRYCFGMITQGNQVDEDKNGWKLLHD